jgi:hypothetical protein
MIAKKKRTPLQKAALIHKQWSAYGIGLTRAQEKAKADAHENEVIKQVHDYIWATRPSCQLCHGSRLVRRPDHMHEDPSRAQTRGMPPEQRFNLVVCGRLCEFCHRDVTHNVIRIVFKDRSLGFMGELTYEVAHDRMA